jgi:NTE family protein
MDMSVKTRVARPRAADSRIKPINLALQGGGAHGAFAWGVLDRIIEDGRLSFEGISATSAGAMNAAVLAYGWTRGGRDGAREALAGFWRAVSDAGAMYSPYKSWPGAGQFGEYSLDNSPAYMMMDMATRLFSPYQLNPWNFNPLRDVLERHVDFAALREHSAIKLFLAATNVETCKVRIFQCADVTADAVLASACLPFMFQAVEIDGEFYWDGGFVGNPAIYPLIYHCESRDVVIVHLNPIERRGCPRTAAEIMNRLNEVSFNSSLMREMRAIAFVTSLIERGKLSKSEARQMLIHSIRADEEMVHHGVSSKLNCDWTFLTHLRDKGRAHGERWLASHFDAIGKRSSVDIRAEFL